MFRYAGLLLIAVWCSPGAAFTAPDYSSARQAFLEARAALEAGDRPRFESRLQTLRDYPLYPYLLYWDLRARLETVKPAEVTAFLDRHGELPPARWLLEAWLDKLADRGDWSTYLAFHRPGLGTSQSCRRLQALLRTGRAETALAEVEALWLSGRSQPKACDPVFDAWRDAGQLSPERVWGRIELAMEEGQTGLARYLKRYLPVGEAEWVERWIEIHGHPQRVREQVPAIDAHPRAAQMVVHALRRLAWRDQDLTARLWEQYRAEGGFTDEQAERVTARLALAMATRKHPDAAVWLERAAASDPDLAGWWVREAVRAGDWAQILSRIDALEPEVTAEESWRYWKARALEETGRRADAEAIYANLARERSYYGFLAADRLGSEYQFNDHPLRYDDAQLSALLERWPGLMRSRELHLAGLELDSRREWYTEIGRMGDEELKQAAKLAHLWGWHDRAILTVARAGTFDDLSLRFPLAFGDAVEREARDRELDPSWVFAMLRQESAFRPEARSPVGARGLMQLMPKTADLVARSLNTRISSYERLYEPEFNIRLGTTYLRRVLDRHDSNPVLATAAYNAGPHRVDQWLPEDGPWTPDRWVESVPFSETRTYLQRVFAYTAIYDHRQQRRVEPLSRRMPKVQPAAASPKDAD